MKILVCVKQVPDTTAKLNIAPDNSGIASAGVKWVLNPYDEFAVEEALLLKAKNAGATVTAVTLGPKPRAIDCLRTALAMGADEACFIEASESSDNLLTAKALAAFAEKHGPYDIVFTGKMAIDDSQMAVSQMLAHKLSIPHTTVVSKFTQNGDKLELERSIEGGSKEVIETSFKSVIAADKGLNTPRYASLPGIMKAKKKPVTEFTLADLGLSENDNKLKYSNFQPPAPRPEVKFLQGDSAQQANELVKLLREEAKVI